MLSGVVVNAEDLGSRFGLYIEKPDGVLHHVTQRYPMAQVQGEETQLFLATRALTEVREITLRGVLEAASASAVQAAVDELKRWLANGDLQVSTDYDTTRYYKGRLAGGLLTVEDPPFVNRHATVQATIVCPDANAYASSNTVVAVSTNSACATGTARSRAVITITGVHTNALITLKNGAGTTKETMGFTLSIPGAADTLVIDCENKTVKKTIASVTTNAMDAITSGSFPTFLALDPRDGDQLAGTHPSLSASFGSGTPTVSASYPKRYR